MNVTETEDSAEVLIRMAREGLAVDLHQIDTLVCEHLMKFKDEWYGMPTERKQLEAAFIERWDGTRAEEAVLERIRKAPFS